MRKHVAVLGMVFLLLICASVYSAIADEAAIYLSFEGTDESGASSPCWANRGTTGYGETPQLEGQDPNGTLPVCGRGGLNGGSYDGTALGWKELENAYAYGLPGTLTLGGEDTEVERAIMNIWSFTVTGWFREGSGNTRIMRCPEFEINLSSSDALEIRLQASDPQSPWISSNANYSNIGQWRFFAVTYDGTVSTDNLKFYYGSDSQAAVLDSTFSVANGRLVRDADGSLLVIGNVGIESNRPFNGYIDEIRIYADGPGLADPPAETSVLSLAEIEEIRALDAEWAIVERAAVYLPFEGDVDADPCSPCWANRGTRGYLETPGIVGDEPNDIPTVSSDGLLLKGQYFDARHLTNMEMSNTYAYGQYGAQATGTGVDTEVELALMNVWSFTITGWYRDSVLDQERLLNSTLTEINQRNTLNQYQIGVTDANWYGSASNFYSGGVWRFFAMTYDGTQTTDNFKSYYGSVAGPVTLAETLSIPNGRLVRDADGSLLVLGNAGVESTRPLTGCLDELRIWADGPGVDPDNGAVLTIDQLEMVRQYDLTVPTTCAEVQRKGLTMLGDVDQNCIVDMYDFAALALNWLECNDPADPINCIQNW